MLAELVTQHGGVESGDRQLAPVYHFDLRFEPLLLLAHLVTEAEVLVALNEAERLHAPLRVLVVRRRRAFQIATALLHGSILHSDRAPRDSRMRGADRPKRPLAVHPTAVN